MKTARFILSNRSRRIRGAIGRELLVGLVTALLCAVLWAVLTHYMGKDLAYGALGMGIVIGLAITLATKVRSIDNGITAAGFTAIAVLLGKLIIVQWGLNTGLSTANLAPVNSSTTIQQTDGWSPTELQPINASTQPIDAERQSHQPGVVQYSRIKNALTVADLLWLGLSTVTAFLIGMNVRFGKPTSAAPPPSDPPGEGKSDVNSGKRSVNPPSLP